MLRSKLNEQTKQETWHVYLYDILIQRSPNNGPRVGSGPLHNFNQPVNELNKRLSTEKRSYFSESIYIFWSLRNFPVVGSEIK
jgi:hypothetical protein